MTTTYYVVPAGSFFDTRFEDFPNREMAEQFVEVMSKRSETDYGIWEVRLVAGISKTVWGDRIHIRSDRRIVTRRNPPETDWRWRATLSDHDPENNDPRGFGETEQAAIDDLMSQVSATEKMEA